MGQPEAPFTSDNGQGVGDAVLDVAEARLDFVDIIYEGGLQVLDGHCALGRHIFELIGSRTEPLIQQSHGLRCSLQELADGLAVNIALLERLVDSLHQRGNILVGFTGALKQHRGGVVELHRLVDVAEQLGISLYEHRDHVGGVRVGHPRGLCCGHDLLLNIPLISKSLGRISYLVVYTGKLFNKAIDSGKAEPDADCTEQLRGGVFDAGYCVVDLIDILILDFEADLVDELSYRHRHHLALALLNFRSLL